MFTSKVDTVPPVFSGLPMYIFMPLRGGPIISEESGVRSQGKNLEQIPGNSCNSALDMHVSLSSPKVVQRERNPKNTYKPTFRFVRL